jgi:hypothetical protein
LFLSKNVVIYSSIYIDYNKEINYNIDISS